MHSRAAGALERGYERSVSFIPKLTYPVIGMAYAYPHSWGTVSLLLKPTHVCDAAIALWQAQRWADRDVLSLVQRDKQFFSENSLLFRRQGQKLRAAICDHFERRPYRRRFWWRAEKNHDRGQIHNRERNPKPPAQRQAPRSKGN